MRTMRKIIFAALLAALATSAHAQTVKEALRYSQNEYYGTARSIAMGNAFTALGGDLGSVQINPAGSAVNSFSQVTVTPSLDILSGTGTYSASGYVDDGNTFYVQDNSKSKLTMPNIGVMMNYKTHRKSGLKNISLGLVGNATMYYNDDMGAGGLNDKTSYMSYLSAIATYEGLTPSELGKANYRDMNPYFWPAMVGYRSGMVNDAGSDGYSSPVEALYGDSYRLNGTLDQTYGRTSKGSKYDMVMNLGFNFNDRFFIGANLGIVDLDYRFDSYIREYANDPSEFPVKIGGTPDFFSSMKFHQAYSASGTGVYAKFGFIAIPFDGLRVGAAIQTPTANYITENLWFSGNTEFGQACGSEAIMADEEYVYEYKLVSPFRASVGAAYTIPGFGLISADYEICNYGSMKFVDINQWNGYGTFDGPNKSIRDGAGVSHMVRLGAEYTPTPALAIRAGYNLTTTPERYLDKDGYKVAPDANKHAISLGAGYKSAGSFFCDAAIRCTMNPYEYVYPYDNYDDYVSPEIRVDSNLWNLVLTFGWRF